MGGGESQSAWKVKTSQIAIRISNLISKIEFKKKNTHTLDKFRYFFPQMYNDIDGHDC